MTLEKIRALVFDVDGVLTDGSVFLGGDGEELKRFSVVDGIAFRWCRLMEFELAMISGRRSGATTRRAQELGIEAVYQGVHDKRRQLLSWAATRGLEADEVLYMGDDHIDLPVFEVVGASVAPANAVTEVREAADFVTEREGGAGAVRDAVEWLLRETGRFDEATRRYRQALIED